MDKPEDVLGYLILEVSERGGTLGKTKLVKLAYLTDIEHYSRVRQTLTGFRWVYHYYGPYSFDFEAALARLELDIPQESVPTTGGYQATVFRVGHPDDLRRRIRLSDQATLVAQRVLDRWALEDLYPLLSHVYFDTAPMKGASPGDTLDFSTIPPAPVGRRPRHELPPVDERRLQALREAFEEAGTQMAEDRRRAEAHKRNLFSAPDQVFEREFLRFVEQEQTGLPEGAPVSVAEDFNETTSG
jgi:catechol 2,3-dioxygenase-like lactoylglutathione lyase family enzyme